MLGYISFSWIFSKCLLLKLVDVSRVSHFNQNLNGQSQNMHISQLGIMELSGNMKYRFSRL